MKFDNAFKTAAGTVGMQFKEKGVPFTVYRDKEGKLVVSEHATVQQKGILVVKYEQMSHKFFKAVA